MEGVDIDLQQGLGQIADDAPTAHLSADALWREGVRRRNRRRAAVATAALAAVALVAGAVGLAATPGVLRTDRTPPAASSATGHLPDRVWMPSPWTPGTGRAGDPGRIAVLFWDNGQRRSGGGADGGGWMSVSAVDGRYRYLDLPDLLFDGSDAPVLSPDGRYLAYPLRAGGADASLTVSRGWAVYDAQTGRVRRHLPAGAPKGLGNSTIVWTPDSRVLLMDVCRVTSVSKDSLSCNATRTDLWDVTTGRQWSVRGTFAADVVGRDGDRLVVSRHRRGLGEMDVATGRTRDLGLEPPAGRSTLAVAWGDPAVVLTGPGSTNQGTLRLATVPVRDDVATGPLRTVESFEGDVEEVGGVLADGRVVLTGLSPVRVGLLDPSGRRTELVRFDAGWTGALPQVATELAAEPTVPGVRPPHVRDPRLVGAAAALGLAVLVGLGLLWRRRRLRGVTA